MPAPINGEFYTEADDRLMFTTPDEWPLWPVLPLKWRGQPHDNREGLLVDAKDERHPGKVVVYRTNMYRLKDQPLTEVDVDVYDTPEAAVAAGWRVD